jgi:Transglutaminase-like superfamily
VLVEAMFVPLSTSVKWRYGCCMPAISELLRISVRVMRLTFLGIELLANVGLAAWTVRFVPFKRYSVRLKVDPLLPQPSVRLSRDVRRIVRLISHILPERSQCLVCGIAAKRVLARRGFGSELSFGVNPSATPIVAHAWLIAGSVIVTGRDEKRNFEEIVRL